MSLLVTGSIGIDIVETPHGRADDVLGGTAVNFAFAARLFGPVRLVGVVGEDFPPALRDRMTDDRVDLAGLEVRRGSKTFRWHGRYSEDMNTRDTVSVQLNVLAEAGPKIPPAYADSRYVFLGATHPALQQDLISQLKGPALVVADTMDLWIETQRGELERTLGRVGGVVLNDGEARMLTDETNLVTAGKAILKYGPKFVVIKKGEHGAVLVTRDRVAAVPAYYSENVKDPTGAGDSFAGGLMGYLTRAGKHDADTLIAAMVRGTIAASFLIEDFSINRLRALTQAEFDRRLGEYFTMVPRP